MSVVLYEIYYVKPPSNDLRKSLFQGSNVDRNLGPLWILKIEFSFQAQTGCHNLQVDVVKK
jgi:hypothetical protein